MATSIRRTTTTVRTARACVVSENQKSDKLLTDLFTAYYQARKNKRSTHSQMRFERNLSENLVNLYHQILSRSYVPGRSICFIIRDPVQREVFAASFRDRVVHHYLYSKLNPIFDERFIEDSYSCRVGKGTHYGVHRLSWHMHECQKETLDGRAYVLKMDISGYFMNINRKMLYEKIVAGLDSSAVDDFDTLDFLLCQVIFTNPLKGCRIKGSREDWNGLPPSKSLFHSPDGCGLPIGNLTSQLFSNIYLSDLDYFITKTLGFVHYGRYVDDFYLVSSSKQSLLESIPKIKSFLKNQLNLTLHPKKIYLQDVTKGVRFLGYWVFPSKAYTYHKSRHRAWNHVLTAQSEVENPYYVRSVLRSFRGMTSMLLL